MSLKLQFILEAVDKATAKVRAVNAAVEKIGEPARRVRAALNAFANEAGLPRLQEQMERIGQRAQSVGNSVRGMAFAFGAATAASGAVFFGLKQTIDSVDRALDVSKKLNIPIEQFQKMGYAAQMNGSSQEDLGQALTFLSKNMIAAINGSKELQVWFARLGVPLERLRKINVAEMWEAMADKFLAVGDAGQNAEKKLTALAAVTGKTGPELKQLLDIGSKGMRQFYKEAERLGAVVDGPTAEAMGDFNDNFDRLKFSIFGVMAAIAKTALPQLDAMVKKLTELNVASRGEWGRRLGNMIGDIVTKFPGFLAGAGQLAAVLVTIAISADMVARSLGGWENVMLGIAALLASALIVKVIALGVAIAGAIPVIIGIARAARILLLPVLWDVAAGFAAVAFGLLATPFGWVILGIAAVAAGATLIYSKWEPIKAFFVDLMATVAKVLSAVGKVFSFDGGGPSLGYGSDPLGNPVPSMSFGPESASGSHGNGRDGNRRTDVGGTLRITIDSEGRPKVSGLKTDNPNVNIDVYTGLA